MPSHVFKIEDGKFGLSLTDPAVADACAATIADFDDFSCQITSGALTATPNVTQETIPATFCQPEQSTPSVGATTFALDLGYLQDPDVVDGLSQFLFENDTQKAWFFFGMDNDDPPKAVGVIRLVAGAIGGDARVALTATVSLPVDGKPDVCFGTATTPALVATEPVAEVDES